MADNDAMREGIENALDQAMAKEKEFVTKWTFLAETMDSKGKRGFWTFSQRGATPWDILGLLLYAFQLEQAQTIQDEDEEK